MTNTIKLSWLIPTKNKLLSLTEVLSRLIPIRKPDEEIIVIDGASTDGTVNYLQKLYNKGDIQQFLSEPDYNEGHAFNKGLLLAKGELIKLFSDDDLLYWPAVRRCKEFMLLHPEIDWLGADSASINTLDTNPRFIRHFHHRRYEKWLKDSTPFQFSTLGIMIRKSSIPVLGLINSDIQVIDVEYTLRNTAGFANLAWYTNPIAVTILNPSSNTLRHADRFYEEIFRHYMHYGHVSAGKFFCRMCRFEFFKCLHKLRGRLNSIGRGRRSRLSFKANSEISAAKSASEYSEIFKMCESWLKEQNRQAEGEFLQRKISHA